MLWYKECKRHEAKFNQNDITLFWLPAQMTQELPSSHTFSASSLTLNLPYLLHEISGVDRQPVPFSIAGLLAEVAFQPCAYWLHLRRCPANDLSSCNVATKKKISTSHESNGRNKPSFVYKALLQKAYNDSPDKPPSSTPTIDCQSTSSHS